MKVMCKLNLVATACLAAAGAVEGATRVAVLEFGKQGMVRRTTSSASTTTSVEGVASFWSALHGHGRKLQHAGMPMVPDLFSRPDDGLVVALTNVDLDEMPHTMEYMQQGGAGDEHVVGHMKVPGSQCQSMMKRVSNVETVESSQVVATAKKHCKEQGFSGIQLDVTTDKAAAVDASMKELMTALDQFAMESGKSIVVHFIVQEDEGSARRRLASRRLNEDEGEEENRDGEEQDEDANNDNGNYNNGFYGYGYYDKSGEWVTPYKTIFQIQYFNVVLWTSVGLVAIIFYAISLMLNMPLMADTLLFGESAQMVGAD